MSTNVVGEIYKLGDLTSLDYRQGYSAGVVCVVTGRSASQTFQYIAYLFPESRSCEPPVPLPPLRTTDIPVE